MLEYILGKEITSYVERHRALIIYSIVLSVLSSIFVVIPAALLKPFIDEGMKIGNDPVTWKIPWLIHESGSLLAWHKTEKILVENITPNRLLYILTMISFVSVMCKSVTLYFSELCAAAFSSRAVKSLRIDMFSKFVSLPLGFHDKNKSGELIARATADITVMQGTIVNIVIGVVQNPLTAIIFFIYLLFMNFKLTLAMVIIIPLIVWLIRFFGVKLKKHSRRIQDAIAGVTSSFQEGLLCLRVIQGFCKNEYEIKRFNEQADDLYKKVMKWNRWEIGMGPMLDAAVFLVLPVVLIVGKMYFNHTLGELVSILYAFSRTYGPIKKLAKVHNSIKTLQGATARVFGILSTVPDIKDDDNAIILPRHKKCIEFKNVDFGYSPGKLILKNVSFTINAGEMVAFVGSTGAGKSSLMDLIPRFYDIDKGSITIDNMDIRNVTLESLRSQMGVVSQKVLLFHETIADNIAYGQTVKDMDRIIAAARTAYAHDFILAQPQGYDTIVGDQGTLLSGGQRQRIAIARALYVDPAILILDEAASALDSESEKYIQDAIENLQGTRTIIIVAHRLSTILKADRIYVIEDGCIVEYGTRADLLAKEGRFRHLYDLQFSGQ